MAFFAIYGSFWPTFHSMCVILTHLCHMSQPLCAHSASYCLRCRFRRYRAYSVSFWPTYVTCRMSQVGYARVHRWLMSYVPLGYTADIGHMSVRSYVTCLGLFSKVYRGQNDYFTKGRFRPLNGGGYGNVVLPRTFFGQIKKPNMHLRASNAYSVWKRCFHTG